MKQSMLPWLGLLSVVAACGGITQPLGEVAGKGGSSGEDGGAGRASAGSAGKSASSGGAAADPYTEEPCYTPCAEKIFRDPTGCKLCHSPIFAASGLDLDSVGRVARLKDMPAMHGDLADWQGSCPVGDKLIDSAHVEDSWLLKKVLGQQGNCGDRDPPVGYLGVEELSCFTTYIECVAAR